MLARVQISFYCALAPARRDVIAPGKEEGAITRFLSVFRGLKGLSTVSKNVSNGVVTEQVLVKSS